MYLYSKIYWFDPWVRKHFSVTITDLWHSVVWSFIPQPWYINHIELVVCNLQRNWYLLVTYPGNQPLIYHPPSELYVDTDRPVVNNDRHWKFGKFLTRYGPNFYRYITENYRKLYFIFCIIFVEIWRSKLIWYTNVINVNINVRF